MEKHDQVEILLVEDNPDDAELTLRALQKSKLVNKILHVRDGQEALDFLFCENEFSAKKLTDIPKVILLDLKMPKVSGLEVLKKIKGDERTKMIPCVILTSSKEDKDILESYKIGVNSYIVKPVDFENFFKAVTEIGLYWMLLNQPSKP